MEKSATDDVASQDAASVFVSYSRKDRPEVMPIIEGLEKAGITVWWDGLLEAGNVFLQTTEDALENAAVVLVVWTKTSINSNWVRDEATSGRDDGRLVPLTIDGSMAPLGFRQFQIADLSGWRGDADAPEFAEIIRSVRTLVNQSETQTPSTAPIESASTGKGSAFTRRTALLAGGTAVVAGAAIVWNGGWLEGAASQANSIAVLPFNNISGDRSQDYFADGLSEELRSTLSLNQQLQVAAKTSSNSFRDKQLEVKAIANKLGVSHILDGSVRRAGNVIRVSAQLIDGETGFEKWSESFDREMTDIFAIQSEIATTVTDALIARISSNDITADKLVGGTANDGAYDAYLRGKALYDLAKDEETDREALGQFDRAIELDANYAAAHAAKSRVLTVIANSYASGGELGQYYDRAVESARLAIASAPLLAEGHSALGFVLFNGRLDVNAAFDPYQKAHELGYGNADILSAYSNFMSRIGKFPEARRAIQRAKKLDPLNPSVFRNAGVIEYGDRKYEQATDDLRKALAVNPKTSVVYSVLGDIALINGDPDEAKKLYLQESGALGRQKGLAIVERKLGNLPAAENALDSIIADFGNNSLYQQAQVAAQWGDLDAGVILLERAMSAGDSGLIQSRNDPLLDPLRDDQRFEELQKKLGFE